MSDHKNDLLYSALDKLDAPRAPVSADELDRLCALCADKRSAADTPRPQRKKKHPPVFLKFAVSLAACCAVMLGVNAVNPTFAEGIPLLGDVFALINQNSQSMLRSDQLSDHAVQTAIPAQSSAPAANAATAEESAATPYALTLSQVYCDGMYLRLGVVFTAADDSLAAYDYLGTDYDKQELGRQGEDIHLLGDIELNGQTITPGAAPRFIKQDDHTFIASLDYDLAGFSGAGAPFTAAFRLPPLVGCTSPVDDAKPLRAEIPDGNFTLELNVTPDVSANRTASAGEAQNDITLENILATPGETRLTVCYPDRYQNPAITLHTADGEKLQCARGQESDDSATTRVAYDFDAVPAGVSDVVVRVIDKNADDAVLAEFSLHLE